MVALSFKKYIPNFITITRILLLIPIICLISIKDLTNNILCNFYIDNFNLQINLGYILALVLFILASISDFFDGYLARKWDVNSIFGKIIDPIADKILINSIYIILVIYDKVFFPMIIVMIIRDILMDGIRIYVASKKINIAANIYGKIKTLLQIISIIFVLIISSDKSNNWWYYGIQNLFIYLASICSVCSLIIYAFKFYKAMNYYNKTSFSDI